VSFPAFFDTNVLYGSTLCDLLLWLADGNAFRPLWSEGILAELEKNLLGNGIDEPSVRKRVSTMRLYFPDAMVDGYDDLIDGMTCDEKDRHVLAAAVRANAEVLVTFNLRDFPDESLEPFEIEAVHPDEFLLDQLDLYPGLVTTTLERLIEIYENPSLSMDELLQRLATAGVPRFASEAMRHF
jgi:predicted nucleic acid-binding protein